MDMKSGVIPMYKILRKESFKRLLPRIIACALVLVVLLGLCGSGLLRLLAGPKPLDAYVKTGDYVSFDASEVIVAFASLSSKSDSGSETLKTYYLLTIPDVYLAVVDRKEQNSAMLEKAMEQSHEYYLGDLDTLTEIGTLRGTVKPLEDGMADYMADCLDKYELPDYDISLWQIELNSVGLFSETWVKILGAAAAVVFLLLVAQLVVIFSGCYQRHVRNMLGDSVSDETFSQAAQIERMRVGEYIWYSKGPGSRALKTSEIIWGYAMPEPMVVSKYRWPVALYTVDQTMLRINFMEQKSCERFLANIAAQGHPFVQGYTTEYAEKFQNNFEAFLADAAHTTDREQA